MMVNWIHAGSGPTREAITRSRSVSKSTKPLSTPTGRCMEKLGYSLKSFRLEPLSRDYDWTVPRQAQSDALAQACEADHLADADLRWQSQRQCKLAPLWERRRLYIIDCLASCGVHIDARLPYPAVVAVACTAGHSDCVVAAPWDDQPGTGAAH